MDAKTNLEVNRNLDTVVLDILRSAVGENLKVDWSRRLMEVKAVVTAAAAVPTAAPAAAYEHQRAARRTAPTYVESERASA